MFNKRAFKGQEGMPYNGNYGAKFMPEFRPALVSATCEGVAAYGTDQAWGLKDRTIAETRRLDPHSENSR